MDFESPDLRAQRDAARYVKQETVQVVFARSPGSLESREGPNHYRAGDALITGSGGDRWSVSRDRFDARYQPLPPLRHGSDGAYRNRPLPVLARQIPERFTVRRCIGGDLLHGSAGDWLLQYAPGDWGIVEAARFQRLYRPYAGADPPAMPPRRR
ncbi:MAG: PGDYG domain-containing protein [Steroidobacterales bacterium]